MKPPTPYHRISIIVLLGVMGIVVTGSSNYHPLKMSVCHMEQDRQAGQMRYTFSFFADDFGAHLKETNRMKDLDFAAPDKALGSAVSRYVLAHFSVHINTISAKLKMDKMALDADQNLVNVTFTSEWRKEVMIRDIQIFNDCMFDAFDTQQNIVYFHFGKFDGKALLFEPGDEQQTID